MDRILVVDDDVQVARSLARTLKRHGYQVEIASSPDEALASLAPFRPHLVVSDFQMPGMNGAELLARVRAFDPRIGRLMLSGYANLIDGTGVALCAELVSKPWENEVLLAAVHRNIPPVGARPISAGVAP